MAELKYYTIDEVMELLSVNRNTVYRYIRNGDLQGVKLAGRSWRFTPEDIEAFIDKMRQKQQAKKS